MWMSPCNQTGMSEALLNVFLLHNWSLRKLPAWCYKKKKRERERQPEKPESDPHVEFN